MSNRTPHSAAEESQDIEVGFLDQFNKTYLTAQLGAGHTHYGYSTVGVDGVGLAGSPSPATWMSIRKA